MKKKQIIIISLIVFGVILSIFTFGNKIARKIPLVTVPYSKAEILRYLENNYHEKFIIKKEITLNEETKDLVYIVAPKNNESLEFYVLDEYDNGYIGLGGSKGPSRELHDTYTNALLLNDLPKLKNIYPNINLEEYSVNDQYFISGIWMGSTFQRINLSFSSYHEVDNVAEKFMELYLYIKDNFAKYKPAHTTIKIETNGVYAEVGDSPPNIESIKDNMLRWLIENYREKGNQQIFEIPARIKEKHLVKDIGWGNQITKVYVNNNLVNIQHYQKVKIFYLGGCLQISVGEILEIIPELKNKLKTVNHSTFEKLNKIPSEEDIIFAYEKDHNIYLLTENKSNGWTAIYQYKSADINQIEWDHTYISSLTCNDTTLNRSEKYFGIKITYDFEKEILHFNY